MLENPYSAGIAFVVCSEMGGSVPCLSRYDDLATTYVWQNFGGSLPNELLLKSFLEQGLVTDVVILGHHPCAVLDLVWGKDVRLHNSRQADLLANSLTDALRSGNRTKQQDPCECEDHVLRELVRLLDVVSHSNLGPCQQFRAHGWLWTHESDELLSFDPEQRKFVVIDSGVGLTK